MPEKVKDMRGVYRKFTITRTDGAHRKGRKHCGCRYFVLDMNCDKHAVAAIKAYAKSCKKEYPALARDLECWIKTGIFHL